MQQIRMIFVEGEDGFLCFVDDEAYQRLAKFRWIGVRAGRDLLYARASLPDRGREYLHRAIIDAKAGEIVDHKSGLTADCTCDNLRRGTHVDNVRNSCGRPAVRRSRFKGVSPGVGRMAGTWRAQIKVAGRQRHLGHFPTEEAAAEAYNAAAADAFGECARLNDLTATC